MSPEIRLRRTAIKKNCGNKRFLVKRPSGPSCIIHDQVIAWKRDRCIQIDDSYEHEVFQQSDRRRVVFILDLPHPELLPADLEFMDALMRSHLNHFAVPVYDRSAA